MLVIWNGWRDITVLYIVVQTRWWGTTPSRTEGMSYLVVIIKKEHCSLDIRHVLFSPECLFFVDGLNRKEYSSMPSSMALTLYHFLTTMTYILLMIYLCDYNSVITVPNHWFMTATFCTLLDKMTTNAYYNISHTMYHAFGIHEHPSNLRCFPNYSTSIRYKAEFDTRQTIKSCLFCWIY